MNDPVLTALTTARELISDPARWAKGTYRGDHGYCAVGALYNTLGAFDQGRLTPKADKAFRVAYGYLQRLVPPFRSSIETYNDDPDTRHVDIMALFDRAIVLRREDLGLLEPVEPQPEAPEVLSEVLDEASALVDEAEAMLAEVACVPTV